LYSSRAYHVAMNIIKNIWLKLVNGDWVIFSSRELWTLVAIIGLALCLALFALFRFVEPPPPKIIKISTGAKSGAYYKYATQYAEKLKKHGITLEVLESTGTPENLKRLNDPAAGVGIAFVQTGVGNADENPNLESLATIAYEPIWILSQKNKPFTRPIDLLGKAVVIGPDGSGTQPVALEILKANGIDQSNARLMAKSATEGMALLNSNQVDALIMIAAPSAPIIQQAFAEGYAVMDFDQADAYVRRYPWMAKITLPKGSANLAGNSPDKNIQLVGANTNLVTRSDVHRAIAFLLLDVAAEIHAAPGLVHDLKQFPNEKSLQFVQSEESVRFFKTGRPFLQRYLPFWLANLFERLLVSIVPILAIGIPLLKIIPAFFDYREKAAVLQLYDDVFHLEYTATAADLNDSQRIKKLDEIESKIGQLRIGAAHHPSIYHLRLHLQEVRSRHSPRVSA
jgi:TRAP transporter TAXI family solute receptor